MLGRRVIRESFLRVTGEERDELDERDERDELRSSESRE